MKQRSEMTLFIVFLIVILPSFGQQALHFYNVDQEIRVEGKIQKITMEPRYKDSSPFLILILEQKNTKKLFQVEISPVWSFDYDFHKGEHLMVIGSLYSSEGMGQNIIAREVQFRGETLVLRDEHGFPNWRGGKGQMRRKGKGKGKRY